DLHQAGRLCLLAERSVDAQARQAAVQRFASHGDLSDAFVHHRVVDTEIAVTPRPGGELVCATPSTRVAGHRATPLRIGLVEELLALHPGVGQLACALHDGAHGPELVAWVQPSDGRQADRDALEDE